MDERTYFERKFGGVTLTVHHTQEELLHLAENEQVSGTLQTPGEANEEFLVSVMPCGENKGSYEISLAEGQKLSLSALLSTGTGVEIGLPACFSFAEQKIEVEEYKLYFSMDEEVECPMQFRASSREIEFKLCERLAFTGISVSAFISDSFFSACFTTYIRLGTGDKSFDMNVAFDFGVTPVWSIMLSPADKDAAFPGIGEMAVLLCGIENYHSLSENVPWDSSALDAGISGIAVDVDVDEESLKCVRIQTLIKIGILRFHVQFEAPGLTMSGGMCNEEPVFISDVMRSMGVNADGVPPDLAVSIAGFYASVKEKKFSVDLAVQGIWGFGKCGDGYAVYLDEIEVQVDYADGNTEGEIRGVILFADHLEVSLTAAYHSADGWVFSGKAVMRDAVSLSVLIDYLKKNLGMDTVNDSLDKIRLQELSVSYKTETKELRFLCEVEIPDIGRMSVEFYQEKERLVLAKYEADGDGKIALRSFIEPISEKAAQIIPSQMSISLRKAQILVYWEQTEDARMILSVETGMSITLDAVPLLGDMITDVRLGVDDITIGYAFAGLSDLHIKKLLELSERVTCLPEQGVSKGFYMTGTFLNNDTEENLMLGQAQTGGERDAGNVQQRTDYELVESASDEEQDTSRKWFDIQKKFGVLQLGRIGIGLKDSDIRISVDASMLTGGLLFSVKDMGLSVNLDSGKVRGFLAGMEVGFMSSGLEISGSLQNIPPTKEVSYQFDGSLSIRMGEWQFLALASFAQLNDKSMSFFAFLKVNGMIGGVPAFMITGLMGGIGINRKLVIPSLNEVCEFPLLKLGGGTKSKSDVIDMLEGRIPGENGKKKQWLRVSKGDYWLAAGIEFTSCELVEGKLLLIASFNQEISFALLGLASLVLPKGKSKEEAYVFLEMQMQAVLNPSQGIFIVQACITPNSFLLYKDCRLHGSFAFAMWFGKHSHAGQFVITIGGYHPAFCVPDYYPKAEPVGFSWQVSAHVTAKGEAYLAVTPSCVMAGGRLEILYQLGNLKAWFCAYAHFLIAWKPFYFMAEIGVEVGASYRIRVWFIQATIKVSVGATLKLWGPPTGGTARIHLSILSFHVNFGASNQTGGSQESLSWKEVKELLPKEEELCTVQPSNGVYEETDTHSGKIWSVSGAEFAFAVRTSIPVEENGMISVRPMNCSQNVSSKLKVEILRKTGGSYREVDLSRWGKAQYHQAVPASLWGTPISENGRFVQRSSKPSADTVPDCCMGYDIRVPKTAAEGSVSTVMHEKQCLRGCNPLAEEANISSVRNKKSTDTITFIKDVEAEDVKAERRKAFHALKCFNETITSGDFPVMVIEHENLFTDQPLEAAQ